MKTMQQVRVSFGFRQRIPSCIYPHAYKSIVQLTRRKIHAANDIEPKTPDSASCVASGGLWPKTASRGTAILEFRGSRPSGVAVLGAVSQRGCRYQRSMSGEGEWGAGPGWLDDADADAVETLPGSAGGKNGRGSPEPRQKIAHGHVLPTAFLPRRMNTSSGPLSFPPPPIARFRSSATHLVVSFPFARCSTRSHALLFHLPVQHPPFTIVPAAF